MRSAERNIELSQPALVINEQSKETTRVKIKAFSGSLRNHETLSNRNQHEVMSRTKASYPEIITQLI